MTWTPRPGDDAILARITERDIARADDLKAGIDAMDLVDVVRVFVAAGHALIHRAPTPVTPEALARDLAENIDELHRAGLP